MSESAFDTYAPIYAETVNESVRFGGKDVEFFARCKVRELLNTASRLGRPPDQMRVLDVGSGTGMTDSFLLPRFGSVQGVDVSPEMVSEASTRNPAARYQLYDGEHLPFSDRQFDLVFAACVLHHVPPRGWKNFLTEIWRVTGPSSAAVVIEHNPLNPLTRRAVNACPFDEDAVLARPGQVRRIFAATGARRLQRKYITFLPFDSHRARQAEAALGWLPLGAQYTFTAFK